MANRQAMSASLFGDVGCDEDQAGIVAQLRLHNAHGLARYLHRTLLDDPQGRIHQHRPHLGHAAAQDDHLRIKAMNDINQAHPDCLSGIFNDGPCQWYARLGCQRHRTGIDMQVFLFWLLTASLTPWARITGFHRWEVKFHCGRVVTLGRKCRGVCYCTTMLEHRAGKS